MATLDEVMELLREACPEFRPRYEEYLRAFYDPDQVPEQTPYADVSAFTTYLIDAFETGRTRDFSAAFALAERLLDEGDDEMKNWVVAGLLEGLQNQLSHTNLGYDVYLPWLGPKSRYCWQKLIEAWGG
ncbi:MAG TPA: hypothetical protein VGP82_00205 [Ktedonobacterales bacterium]|jgi:hypothetical protein|nr:hypothetical protein [Ktedonobacterales bacterium]